MRPRKVNRGTRTFKRKRSKRSKKKPVERPLSCFHCKHHRGSRACAMRRPQTEPRRFIYYGFRVERWFRDGKWCPDFKHRWG